MELYSLSLSFTVATATAAVCPSHFWMGVSTFTSVFHSDQAVEMPVFQPVAANANTTAVEKNQPLLWRYAIAQNALPDDWQQFAYPQAGFAVRMPQPPKEVTEQIDTSFGKLDIHTLSAQQSGIGYLAVYANYPNHASLPANRQQILEAWKQEFVNAAGLQILQERALDFNGYPGTEIRYTNGNGEMGKARFYFVQQRIYQILAATSQQQESTRFGKYADRFLDSFELLDN
ncbi:hypothetical protein [Geitlerinema sp. PCC 9228]|uniref:hypothetical protein n=1 Tax=Geitlerinema sp. PCC 9228 TaxID=111611 RepID=UPI001114B174|nr:hypothetical protein [Geitlerinema sp. PCC 9228]